MIQCSHCYHCGESAVPVDGTITTVRLNSPKHCGQCHVTKDRDVVLFFCRPEHMVAYMAQHGETLAALTKQWAAIDTKIWPYRVVGGEYQNVLEDIPRANAVFRKVVRQTEE